MTSPLFAGRLGIEGARIPHTDRHGLLWLSRGNLTVIDGTLRFLAADGPDMRAGDYSISYQAVSMILLGPGSTVSHDALRVLARHNTLLAAIGDGGVKFYTAPPMGRKRSSVARAQATLWADKVARIDIARHMYARRFGSLLPHSDIAVLRGIEGSRMKECYRVIAKQNGIQWKGRRYDRNNPDGADVANQAINHVATFVEAAADIAVASVGALPPLGFIHEDSSNSFTLDVADIWRATVTLPTAFRVAARVLHDPGLDLERETRKEAASVFRSEKLIPSMIDEIRGLLRVDDRNSNK